VTCQAYPASCGFNELGSDPFQCLVLHVATCGTFVVLVGQPSTTEENDMTFGKGALLWLIGVPIPIIILLALFWHS
jgi:hypothetical protein